MILPLFEQTEEKNDFSYSIGDFINIFLFTYCKQLLPIPPIINHDGNYKILGTFD
jgi:hypothetical protein